MVNRVSLEPLQKALSKDVTILVPNNRLRDALIGSYTETRKNCIFFATNHKYRRVDQKPLGGTCLPGSISFYRSVTSFFIRRIFPLDKHNRERTI